MMKKNESFQSRWLQRWEKELKKKTLKPVMVQWLCTQECNFTCGHCGTDSGKRASGELTTREMLRVADDLKQLGCQRFAVTGGEPLVRKDIFEVLGYIKSREMKLFMVTNGYLTPDYFLELKDLGLDGAAVSIDGYRQKHDRARNMSGSYKRCLESLEIYNRLKVPVIQVNTVVSAQNIKDIPRVIKDVFEHGCKQMRLQVLIPEGRARGQQTPMPVVREALRIMWQARKKGVKIFAADNFGYLGPMETKWRNFEFFCVAGWWSFSIMQNGDVMGCPVIGHPELVEGNLRSRDLKDIWWNGFARFRKTMIEDLPQECRECDSSLTCRGGCWSLRANGGNFCFLDAARQARSNAKKLPI